MQREKMSKDGVEITITLNEKQMEDINNKILIIKTECIDRINKAIELLDNYQNNLYSKTTRETLDDDIETAIKLLRGEIWMKNYS